MKIDKAKLKDDLFKLSVGISFSQDKIYDNLIDCDGKDMLLLDDFQTINVYIEPKEEISDEKDGENI